MRARLVECDRIDFSQFTYSKSVEHALLLVPPEFVLDPKEAIKVLQIIADVIISCLELNLSREY